MTLGFLLGYLFINIPHFQKIGSYVFRAFSFFRFAERASVAMNLEADLNSIKETVNSQVEGLIPYSAKIKWVQGTDPKSLIDKYKGEVIIKMKHHSDQARNRVYAAMAYVSTGLIPESRLYIDRKMCKSIDFTFVKKILLQKGTALDYFFREIVRPEMGDQETRKYLTMMENLDEEGTFTRMLLRELKELGRIYPRHDEKAFNDTKKFADYLNKLATRKPGEHVQLSFEGDRLRVSSMLIAKPETVITFGIEHYVDWAKLSIEKGIDSIYVLARGRNIELAKLVMQEIEKISGMEKVEGTDKEYITHPGVRSIQTICALFRLRPKQIKKNLKPAPPEGLQGKPRSAA